MTHTESHGSDITAATPTAYRALLCLTGAVAAVTFALSYYGIRDYAERVMGLPRWMSWLAPVAVDVFSLVGLVSAIALATARWRSRAYAWFVFVVAAVASVGANVAHANERRLAWEGIVGAAAVPLFFLLSSHLVVVVRRHVVSRRPAPSVSQPEGASRQVTADVAPVNGVAVPAPMSHPHVSQVSLDKTPPGVPDVSQPVSPPATRAPARGASRPATRGTDDPKMRAARRRVTKGDTCADVAVSLGVSKKTVERWTADIRASRATPPPSDTGSDTGDDPERHQEPVNNSHPHLIGASA